MNWIRKRLPESFLEYVSHVTVLIIFIAILFGVFFVVSWLANPYDIEFYMMGLMVGAFLMWYYNHTKKWTC